MVLKKTLEGPLDCKEIKPVNPKENQSWIFFRRTDAEAEALILWLPDVKNWLIRKDSDAGKDRRQEEKGTTEDYMAGWHHWLNGHEFEQALEAGEGQGSLVCCSPWGSKSQTQLSGRTTTVFTTLYIRAPELIYLLDASLAKLFLKLLWIVSLKTGLSLSLTGLPHIFRQWTPWAIDRVKLEKFYTVLWITRSGAVPLKYNLWLIPLKCNPHSH